jgi:hypothetical protein
VPTAEPGPHSFNKIFSITTSIILDFMYNIMNLKRLYIAHMEGVPLYKLKSGERYKYVDDKRATEDCVYTFVKHCEYEFPKAWRLGRRNIVSYQYKVSIPDSFGHQVVFVDETALVQPLDFNKESY